MSREWPTSLLLITPALFLPLVWITILIRLYVKRCMLRLLTPDDWLMVLATILYSVMSAVVIAMAHAGMGQHQDTLAEDQISLTLELFFYNELCYIACIFVAKCAVAVLLYRLAVKKWIRLAILANIGWFAVIVFICIFVTIFQCRPVHAFWDRTEINDATCIPKDTYNVLAILFVVANTSTDLVFATLPVYMVWSIRLDTRTKISVIVVLSLGYLTSIVAMVRFSYTDALSISSDNTYTTVPILIISVVEVGLAIMAGSMATFRPLLRNYSKWRRRRSGAEESAESSELKSHPVISKARTESKAQTDLCPYPHLSSVLDELGPPSPSHSSHESIKDVFFKRHITGTFRSVGSTSTSSASDEEEVSHALSRISMSTVDTFSDPRGRQGSILPECYTTPLTPAPEAGSRIAIPPQIHFAMPDRSVD